METSIMGISKICGLALSLAAPATTALRAQDLLLTGHVSSDGGRLLFHAQVFLEATGIGGLTDVDGKYAFILSAARLHGQTAKLTARIIGFKPSSVDVVLSGTTIEHDFMLSERPALPALVVRDSESRQASPQGSAGSAVIERITGLPSLQDGPHRKGEREIRLWDTIAIAYPSALYRIINRSGKVTGEQIRYVVWRSESDRKYFRKVSPKMAHDMCTTFTLDSLFTCHARISRAVDWREIWKRLELADVWNIPDQSESDEPFVMALDGTFMTVEIWDGQHYRRWSYGNPSELSDASAVRETMLLIH
jgi:hypothetical protein